MKKFCFIICFLHLAASLAAQVKAFSVETDKNSIVIGDQLQLIVKTVFSSKEPFKPFAIDSIAHFEILSSSKSDSQEQGSELLVQQTFLLTSWDSGRWMIPAFSYEGKTSVAIAVTVSFSAFNPAQDYHDIKDIFEVEKPKRTNWYWYLLGLLLLLVLGILLFPAGKKQEASTPSPPKITYDSKQAMQALAKLEKEQDSLSSKIFYTELMDILRSYLRLRIKADPFTTATELLAGKIAEMGAPPDLEQQVTNVLSQADLAKFAKHEADRNERLEALQAVKKLIQSTDNRH
jgi:hypothetical protein